MAHEALTTHTEALRNVKVSDDATGQVTRDQTCAGMPALRDDTWFAATRKALLNYDRQSDRET